MPQFLEDQLKRAAAAKGMKGAKADRYVYGAMNNMGAMKGNQETAKGARMQAKHDADKKSALTPNAASRIRSKASKMLGY